MDWKQSTKERFSTADSAPKWDSMYDQESQRLDEANFRLRRDYTVKLVVERFGPKARIVDVGCGTGPVVAELNARGFTCLGVDCSADMLAYARRRLASRGMAVDVLLEGDIESLPFPSDHFDCVICLGVISYVPDYAVAMREIHRILKPGGVAIISFRNRYNRLLSDPVALLRHLVRGRRKPAAVGASTIGDFLDPVAVRRTASASGLQLAGFEGIGFGPFRFNRKRLFSEPRAVRVSTLLTRLFALLHLKLPFRWLTDVNVLVCEKGATNVAGASAPHATPAVESAARGAPSPR